MPSWIRSRNGRPRPRYPLAIETTSRRLASTIWRLASWSPASMRLASRTSSAAVSSGTRPMSFEEQLQGVGRLLDGGSGTARPLGLVNDLGGPGERLGLLEQLDARFLELLVDELRRIGVEPESVEYLSDLLEAQEPQFLPAHDEGPELSVVLEYAQLLRRHPPPVSCSDTRAPIPAPRWEKPCVNSVTSPGTADCGSNCAGSGRSALPGPHTSGASPEGSRPLRTAASPTISVFRSPSRLSARRGTDTDVRPRRPAIGSGPNARTGSRRAGSAPPPRPARGRPGHPPTPRSRT